MTHMAATPAIQMRERDLALSKAAQCLAEAHRLLRRDRPLVASMVHEAREELEREGTQ